MCDAGVMAKHNPVPLGRWLRPRVEDERRTVPTSREEREGSFLFCTCLYLPKMEVQVASTRLPPARDVAKDFHPHLKTTKGLSSVTF